MTAHTGLPRTVTSSPAAAPTAAAAPGRLVAVALLAVIIAIASLRLVGLEHLVLWHDEVYTLLRVFGHRVTDGWALLFSDQILGPDQLLALQRPDPAHGLADTWRELTGHPEHAPLYYLLGWLAARLPLDPVVALRGTSALFGLLLPAAAFWLMRELFGRGPAPWIAALLVACSPLHLLYAQEARQYALWTLLTVAASAALVRALRCPEPCEGAAADAGNQPGRRHWMPAGSTRAWSLYALLLAAGLYTHLLFALLLPVHAVYAWLDAVQRSGRLLRPGALPWRPWIAAAGTALLLFLPWALVVLHGLDQALEYTSWMGRQVGVADLFAGWGNLLVRSAVDVWPVAPPTRALLLVVPIAVAVVVYLLRAPRPARWLLPLIALAYAAVVLVPDLVAGGVRSLHGRYTLPALLAVQLMLAWTLGALLAAGPAGRLAGAGALATLVALGLASHGQIARAEVWWNKNINLTALTPRAIAVLHAQQRPFLIVGANDTALGQALAVAHALDPGVRILGIRRQTPAGLVPPDVEQALVLIPTRSVRDALGPGWSVEPWDDGGTWALASARDTHSSPAPSGSTHDHDSQAPR